MLPALVFTLILAYGQTPTADAGKSPPKTPAEFTPAGVEGFVRDTAKARGFVGLQVVVVREGQPALWRLRVGGLADRDAARALCGQVQARGGACSVVGG